MSLLKELGEQYKNKHEQMKENVLSICQDKEYTLAERWELATKNKWAFKHKGWCSGGNFLIKHHVDEDISWYSDFNADRYSVVDLFQIMEEEWTEEEWEAENMVEYCGPWKPSKTWKDVTAVKEAILQSGIGSFTNDW